ncbi:MAG: hypothetical protein ACRD2C_21495, partial [Acidimicrobiales bacterium]
LPVHGPDRVARLMVNLARRRYRDLRIELATINREPGIVAFDGGFLSLCAIAAQTGAHVDLFSGDGAPDPAIGVWAGHLGRLAVFIGCLIGTRTEQVAPTGSWS